MVSVIGSLQFPKLKVRLEYKKRDCNNAKAYVKAIAFASTATGLGLIARIFRLEEMDFQSRFQEYQKVSLPLHRRIVTLALQASPERVFFCRQRNSVIESWVNHCRNIELLADFKALLLYLPRCLSALALFTFRIEDVSDSSFSTTSQIELPPISEHVPCAARNLLQPLQVSTHLLAVWW